MIEECDRLLFRRNIFSFDLLVISMNRSEDADSTSSEFWENAFRFFHFSLFPPHTVSKKTLISVTLNAGCALWRIKATIFTQTTTKIV